MNITHFDAIVVGSGFGGSVMSYRLAEAGLRVCLLERGKAYPPGSFPRSPYTLRESFWNPKAGIYGLYDFWSFHRIHALVASGLGGGSLIYANVLLRKDERWFVDEGEHAQECWPVTRADLEPHYDRVEGMLRPQPYPFEHAPYSTTSKTRAFREAARKVGMKPFFPNLAVTFANEGDAPVPGEPIREAHGNLHGRTRQTCRLCGECDLGCNYGSKNTLDYTYLSEAERLGAELRTGCEVKTFGPRSEGGYSVSYLEHPVQEASEAEAQEAEAQEAEAQKAQPHTITADRLVLAAGSLGSTYLLLRNRSAFPRLSPALGTRFCGNGDFLTFALKTSQKVDGKRVPRVIDPGYGPVITSAVRGDDTLDGGDGRGFYLQDAGFPQHLTWALQTLNIPRSLWQLVKERFIWDWFGKGADPRLNTQLPNLLRNTDLSAGVLPLLAMGRDVPDGTMKLRAGKLDIDWNRRNSGPYLDRVREASRTLAHALGGRFVHEPLRALGRVVTDLNRLITVHPLGGCPMGQSEHDGVVDSYGEVFNYPGLYVADGSVMPGPVGANPSLTIAALADRFAERLIETSGRP